MGPSSLISWSTMVLTGRPCTVTRVRKVSMGCVRAVPAMEAIEPPSARCHPVMSISPELSRQKSLNLSKTKNSTALVGAIRATFSEFPLKSPMGPSVRTIRASVPAMPSVRARLESAMYMTFTRSSGATTERDTPPLMAPTIRCLNTSMPDRSTCLPACFRCLPLLSGNETSTSPRSSTARPHTSNTPRMSDALLSIRKSRNSAKSIAFPWAWNSALDAPRRPPPFENGPLPVLMVLRIFRMSPLLMFRYPILFMAFRSCLSVRKP